ncbi:hypothetical protein CYLTODRAFT_395117 [Cylindrobasidium torrendii FP15055 ss-10]|uniref:Phosphomethylpyrimidine kinase n=1 Tax=Cylindrobasidium torrendii FP15055 ss-10 TaxID=1314674 RepID=A0A0D7BEJ3_9AGAR|nr:hypothetical protein CYLTODRAFT_395117 [Cylindrobasidium torrendii FP15055 ss-10]
MSALTIAGSDCSGGAGIQADLKTFTAHGCYGSSAVTALVAENTVGVQGVHPTPPEFLRQQILSVLTDIPVQAIKTGMLFDASLTRIVVETLRSHYGGSEKMPPLVCDPVCVATSGDSLLNPDATDVLIKELFPLAALITPNKSEAELLLSQGATSYPTIQTLDDMLTALTSLLSFGCGAVLLKGGHLVSTSGEVHAFAASRADVVSVQYDGCPLGENMEILQIGKQLDTMQVVVDMFQDRQSANVTLFVRPRIESESTHGTGCTLSAAIASGLALGRPMKQAVREAAVYTHLGIETATPLGKGHGPLNHMHTISQRILPVRTASNPTPFTRTLIQDNLDVWKAYVEHDFTVQLAQGTLPREKFLHFVKQDYHYLKYYARAYGLLAAKSTTFSAIGSATQTILNVLFEIKNHTAFCASFGITQADLESTEESPACTAYGAFLLDIGMQGDRPKLLMALLACLLGYGEVGLWITKLAKTNQRSFIVEGNPYRHWIEDYAGKEYQEAVRLGLELIEQVAADDPPSKARYEEWCAVWRRCAALEKGFWDMAMTEA